ncbi:hypothetical protein JOQ06_016883, partial [Pogonophryne albipinna]
VQSSAAMCPPLWRPFLRFCPRVVTSMCPWPPTSTPLSPQSCCQFAGHMCQASSPYLRRRPYLGVTVPAT